MTNKLVQILLCALFISCSKHSSDEVIASAGTRALTRDGFLEWSGLRYDSLSADARWPLLESWVEQAMIEQETDAAGLRGLPEHARMERQLASRYYRSVLLSRFPVPEITDSLIADYYADHQGEFRRASDSYLLEGFWSESEDSLNFFRRSLERADTTRLMSDYISWEGKWLAEVRELEPQTLNALRNLPAGGVTQVLPFGEGYRLLRLHEVYPEGAQLSLDAVRKEIRERILTEQSQRRQERWETELRGRYQPWIADETK